MCVPALGAIIQGVSIVSDTVNSINDYNKKSSLAKYQTQVALANMKTAVNQARQEQQQGIEAARKEKISGIQKASLLMASSAAGGFDANSGNNLYNREEISDSSQSNVREIQEKYNNSANSYFERANRYLQQANQISNESNDDLFSFAINGLGSTTSVAKRWYKNGTIF